jgi:hypothetical protein
MCCLGFSIAAGDGGHSREGQALAHAAQVLFFPFHYNNPASLLQQALHLYDLSNNLTCFEILLLLLNKFL